MEISISSMNLRFKVKIFILSKRLNFNFKNVLSYFIIQLIKLIVRTFREIKCPDIRKFNTFMIHTE
jgi:hypothetical protein